MKDKRITGTTRVVGLLGYPVEHSFSPIIHNAAFRELGLEYVYLPFPVKPAGLARAVRGLFQAGVRGLNVTVPHKERVMDCLDEIDDYARALGAVNTVVLERGRLKGYNTDGQGFISSLQAAGFNPGGRTFLVLGAGGAARAVAFALAGSGVRKIYIANRTLKRAEQLAGALTHLLPVEAVALSENALQGIIPRCDCLVNTTTVGMYPHVSDIPLAGELLHPGLAVVDLVYNPVKTRLLAAAERKGCLVVTGLGMLVYQGAASFKLWTGKQAPVKVMMKVLTELNRQ